MLGISGVRVKYPTKQIFINAMVGLLLVVVCFVIAFVTFVVIEHVNEVRAVSITDDRVISDFYYRFATPDKFLSSAQAAALDYGNYTEVATAPYWFVATNGDTTCRAYSVQPTPFRFSYYCANARGATAGSYTAVGNTTTDIFTLGLTGTTPGSSLSLCMVAINTTPNPASMGGFGLVVANSAAYQCGANVMGSVPTLNMNQNTIGNAAKAAKTY